MKINWKGLFRRTNQATELEYTARDCLCGHADERAELEVWLSRIYKPGSLHEKRFRMIAEKFLPGAPKRILEIGSQSGDFSVYCSTLFPQHSYTISDVASRLLEQNLPRTRAFFRSRNIFKTETFFAESIPLNDNSFDIIFIKSAVHHFEDPHAAFEEIQRILRPGGRVIFFNDPVYLNIPVVRDVKKLLFASEDRARGSNCRIYAFENYFSYGVEFAKREYIVDPVYIGALQESAKRWDGIKKYLGDFLQDHFLEEFLIYEFMIPYIFVFNK